MKKFILIISIVLMISSCTSFEGNMSNYEYTGSKKSYEIYKVGPEMHFRIF